MIKNMYLPSNAMAYMQTCESLLKTSNNVMDSLLLFPYNFHDIADAHTTVFSPIHPSEVHHKSIVSKYFTSW